MVLEYLRRRVAAGGVARGEISVATFAADDLHDIEAGHGADRTPWSSLSRFERWLICSSYGIGDIPRLRRPAAAAGLSRRHLEALLASDRPDPLSRSRSTNTTVDALHEYRVDELDPNQTVELDATHLAIGDDDTTPTSADTGVTNEVYRTGITAVVDAGRDLETSTFLSTAEANGNVLREVSVMTAATGGSALNHGLISDIDKDNTKAATIDVVLQFRPA